MTLARIVHALAAAEPVWALSPEDWPPLARALPSPGWPAAAELANLAPDDHDAILDAVAQLATETGPEAEPPLPFWDAVAGLTARAWRLGILDSPDDVVLRLSGHWWDLREGPNQRCEGAALVGAAMGLYETGSYQGADDEALALAEEADALLPKDAVPRTFCQAALWAMRP